MERVVESAKSLLKGWKGDTYTFGFEVLGKAGDYAGQYGKKALVMVADLGQGWMAGTLQTVMDGLRSKGIEAEVIVGAGPNAPREDVYRLALHVARTKPEVIVAVGGGSTIDAAKAANVLATFSPEDVKKALQAGESVAFEDSTNGITAAKAAGIFTVAVPNELTERLDLSQADLKVPSLAAITLAEMDRRIANGKGTV